MPDLEDRERIRAAARAYEQALPSGQRKRLGQFFSGVRLGKLLTHLALSADTRAVLDPMAGHGDLLDATWEAAAECSIRLERLDGIEIDPATAAACAARLTAITSDGNALKPEVIAADAFDPASIAALPCPTYELVITNPPYVRYQARSDGTSPDDKVRSGVIATARARMKASERVLWERLVQGYSGLADLSVPAWLLSALMVKPGGRLALVVPATWRSRDYADVIRYLLLRCFALEFIVEDQQPGWFSDALVRTHLIVARRLDPPDAARPVGARSTWPSALWLQIGPEAADERSLVGGAFGGACPERQFAAWVRNNCSAARRGVSVRRFALGEEWDSLAPRISRRRWYHQLERSAADLPLFVNGRAHNTPVIPDALRDILPANLSADAMVTLEQAGIQVGQGLRTGCNFFFYVTACNSAEDDMVRVQASSVFNHRRFSVPAAALRPVIRRQSEVASFERGSDCSGRVVDLRQWVLPEDAFLVARASSTYEACGETPPQTMPDELADYVRTAAQTPLAGKDEGKRIPDLSAVHTNTRAPRDGRVTPRFWYMLPNFTPRHLPAAFVPRVNHGLAWVESNRDPAILIDANFSTFWSVTDDWPRHALKALLNSAWCRVFMEAVGTSLGGGALKLEATHLRRMPIPVLSAAAKAALNDAGTQLKRNAADIQFRIDGLVLEAIASVPSSGVHLSQLAKAMIDRAHSLSAARQRAA